MPPYLRAIPFYFLSVSIILFSCSIEGPETFVPTLQQTHLVGDIDGFGFGLEDNIWRSNTDGIFDYREEGEEFMDINPAIRGLGSVEYTHSIEIPEGSSIVQSILSIRTYSLQDGDPGEVGMTTNLRLFLDGIEVENAFDDVDQFYRINGEGGSIAGVVKIYLPESMHPELMDGTLNVKLQMFHDAGEVFFMDIFAIDYSQLRIDTIE